MISKSDQEAREEALARREREERERKRYCPFVDLQQCSENCRFFARYSETYCKLKDAAIAVIHIADSLSGIYELLSKKFGQEGSQQ